MRIFFTELSFILFFTTCSVNGTVSMSHLIIKLSYKKANNVITYFCKGQAEP